MANNNIMSESYMKKKLVKMHATLSLYYYVCMGVKSQFFSKYLRNAGAQHTTRRCLLLLLLFLFLFIDSITVKPCYLGYAIQINPGRKQRPLHNPNKYKYRVPDLHAREFNRNAHGQCFSC